VYTRIPSTDTLVHEIMKSVSVRPTEPYPTRPAKTKYISCLQALRVVTKTSGHPFVRKNGNAPRPLGKSWSAIDGALQNGSQLFGAKHIVKTMTVSSKKKGGELGEFFFRVISSQ